MSLIFSPGTFFAARRSFLPRTPTFKIAAGAFAAGAVLATLVSNAPRSSSPAVTAENAAAVEIKSAAEKAKPAKRLEIAAKPKIVPPESRDVADAAPPTARDAAPVTVSDMTAVAKPAEIDDNVGFIARQAVPSPRPKPEALVAMAAKLPAADEAKVPTSNADALAALIAKLNAADATGAPAPETAELPSPDTPAETAAATPQPAPEVKPSAAKPSEAIPAEVKPAQASTPKPPIAKRVASTRTPRHDSSATKPLNLADVRAQQPMRSLVHSRNRADGFTLVRSRTLPDGRRVTVWQRPAEASPSSSLLAFGSLFR